MKHRMIIVFAVSLFATAWASTCKAVGPYFFDDYLPFSNKWSYHKPPQGSTAAGQWATWSNNSIDMTIFWNSSQATSYFDWANPVSIEKFQIRPQCADSADWVFLNGYRANNDPNVTYWIKTDKALLKIAGGTTYDITNIASSAGGCALYNSQVGGGTYIGMPYAPYVFWDQTYELEIWGRISDAQGALTRDFYWKATYEPGQSANNPCWTGANSTRLTILQKEAYWSDYPNTDSSITPGFSTGSGTVDMSALTASNIKLGRYNRYGLDAGPGWTLGTIDASGNMSATNSCIPNVWSY